jgi:hypothetical protein
MPIAHKGHKQTPCVLKLSEVHMFEDGLFSYVILYTVCLIKIIKHKSTSYNMVYIRNWFL